VLKSIPAGFIMYPLRSMSAKLQGSISR
jgi:hypothetical protein